MRDVPSQDGAAQDFPDIRATETAMEERSGPEAERWRRYAERLEHKLVEERKAFKAGNVLALRDATLHVHLRDGALYGAPSNHPDHMVSVPRWAFDALSALLEDHLPRIAGAATGRTAKALKAFRADQVHLLRWKLVKDLKRAGVPWSEVYERAAAELERVHLGVSPATVESSYKMVSQALKDDPGRFRVPDFGPSLIRPPDLG
jgi:hypothetical protein